MKDYAAFLLKTKSAKLESSRLTRQHRDDGLFGWRFGDCHADRNGKVGAPHSRHVHYRNGGWHGDINGKHLILVSDEYLMWEQPIFVASKIQKQSRFGKDITAGTLSDLLRVTTPN